jgi:hypothetical protein
MLMIATFVKMFVVQLMLQTSNVTCKGNIEMPFLEELLFVLAYSVRTQLAIIFGVAFFVGILLLGHHFAETLHFEGYLAPLADLIRSYIEMRYEYAAWAALFTFFGVAIKVYLKDRKHFLQY